jgi:hypothetical protein
MPPPSESSSLGFVRRASTPGTERRDRVDLVRRHELRQADDAPDAESLGPLQATARPIRGVPGLASTRGGSPGYDGEAIMARLRR